MQYNGVLTSSMAINTLLYRKLITSLRHRDDHYFRGTEEIDSHNRLASTGAQKRDV